MAEITEEQFEAYVDVQESGVTNMFDVRTVSDLSGLEKVEKQLKDYNKIALPPIVFDEIYEAIESGVDRFDFSDTDNFDIEYGIEYDGRVHCESHEFRNSQDLVEMIVEKVSKLFVEAECPEELDTTEADNHTVQ